MWTYEQRSGDLFKADGELVATGYSGLDRGKNNPAMQAVHDVGPIPVGDYTIGDPIDLTGGPHGPFVLPLTPAATNVMLGRSGFECHGDSVSHPGSASHGCVIMPRPVREQLAASPDRQLRVIAGDDIATN